MCPDSTEQSIKQQWPYRSNNFAQPQIQDTMVDHAFIITI